MPRRGITQQGSSNRDMLALGDTRNSPAGESRSARPMAGVNTPSQAEASRNELLALAEKPVQQQVQGRREQGQYLQQAQGNGQQGQPQPMPLGRSLQPQQNSPQQGQQGNPQQGQMGYPQQPNPQQGQQQGNPQQGPQANREYSYFQTGQQGNLQQGMKSSQDSQGQQGYPQQGQQGNPQSGQQGKPQQYSSQGQQGQGQQGQGQGQSSAKGKGQTKQDQFAAYDLASAGQAPKPQVPKPATSNDPGDAGQRTRKLADRSDSLIPVGQDKAAKLELAAPTFGEKDAAKDNLGRLGEPLEASQSNRNLSPNAGTVPAGGRGGSTVSCGSIGGHRAG